LVLGFGACLAFCLSFSFFSLAYEGFRLLA
jgi:hypothetical protein